MTYRGYISTTRQLELRTDLLSKIYEYTILVTQSFIMLVIILQIVRTMIMMKNHREESYKNIKNELILYLVTLCTIITIFVLERVTEGNTLKCL